MRRILGGKKPVLTAKHINVCYGALQVLYEVSISVKAGSLVSIVGANCAGKSTLINAISGIRPSASGSILMEGHDITRASPHEIVRRGIVQVPEGRKLFARMTVEENLLLGATVAEAKRRRAETLDYVMTMFPRLRERRGQIASTLSGGEQQMVAIARALMARPKLLMLDEPTLGLAPVMVKEMFETITNLKREGLTILLVEQNVEDSLEICNYGYVLETGRVVLEGSGTQLIENSYLQQAYLGLET